MNENQSEGAAKVVLGEFETAAGEAFGDDRLQASGIVRQVSGHAQEAVGSVQEVLGKVADQARAAASTASEAYGRASDAARDLSQRVEEQPFVSLALAAAVGLLVGLLIAGRGPKIVYVRPRA